MACECLNITVNGQTFETTPTGNTVNGQPTYLFYDGLFGYYVIIYDSEAQNWYIYQSDPAGNVTGPNYASFFDIFPGSCPLGNWVILENEGNPFIDVFTFGCNNYLIDCLNIGYSIGDGPINYFDVNIYQIDGNTAPQFVFEVPEYPGQQFLISLGDYGAPFGFGWYLTTLGPAGDVVSYLDNNGSFVEFPNSGAVNVFGWSINSFFNVFNTTIAKSCPVIQNKCDCGIEFDFILNGLQLPTIQSDAIGLFNGRNYYQFEIESPPGNFLILYCYWSNYYWEVGPVLGGSPLGRLYANSNCPIGESVPPEAQSLSGFWFIAGDGNSLQTKGVECTTCGREDRIFKKYEAIKLPPNFVEENRGLKDCCCENLVLASNSSNSWENDKTSAWIKLVDGSTAQFVLYKNGVETNFTPTPQLFVNDQTAIYTTINWFDVLNSDGVGCYELKINYNIAGITGTTVWGVYKLLPYSIETALHTARVRAIFNGFHEVEQINFTGSNVESSHRFYGFIGKRQPNTEIDNLIYSDRQMKRVLRENLNSYEIITDPLDECQLLPLIDLYLLSENELFISDYNAHNFSYRFNDLPVILEESAEIEYFDFSRKAKLTAKVGDKFKNKRTFFNQ